MSAKALVRITVHAQIEIDPSQPWGDDCTVGQVHRQAKKIAEERTADLVLKLRKMREVTNVRLDPQVRIILEDDGR